MKLDYNNNDSADLSKYINHDNYIQYNIEDEKLYTQLSKKGDYIMKKWNREITKSSILIIASKKRILNTNNLIADVILLPIRAKTGSYFDIYNVRKKDKYTFQISIDHEDKTIRVSSIPDMYIEGKYPVYDIYDKNDDYAAHIFFYLKCGKHKCLDIQIDYNDTINIIDVIDAEDPAHMALYKTSIANILLNGSVSDFSHVVMDGKYIQYNGDNDSEE